MITKILKDWFTGKDNFTFDISLALWALGVLSLIALEWDSVHFHGQIFDPLRFALGLSGVMASGGWGSAQKINADPDPLPQQIAAHRLGREELEQNEDESNGTDN